MDLILCSLLLPPSRLAGLECDGDAPHSQTSLPISPVFNPVVYFSSLFICSCHWGCFSSTFQWKYKRWRRQLIFIFSRLAGGWICARIKHVAYNTLRWLKCECLNIKVLKCFIKVPTQRICQLWSAAHIAHLRYQGLVYICLFIHCRAASLLLLSSTFSCRDSSQVQVPFITSVTWSY